MRTVTHGHGRNPASGTVIRYLKRSFMRVKGDYPGNGGCSFAYNMQVVICDKYIAVIDAKT